MIGAHTHWRLRFPGITSGYVNVGEFYLLDQNMNRRGLAAEAGITYIESGHYSGATYPPNNAFDGATGTLWSGNPNSDPAGAWLGVQFGSPISIGGFFAVIPSASGSTNALLEYSDDGSSWTTAGPPVGVVTSFLEIDGFQETKAPSAKRYWRCVVISAQSNAYASVGELDYRDAGGSIDKSGGTPSASQTTGGYPASNAFDGNNSTFWLSAGTPLPSITFDFGTDVLPTELRIQNRNDSYGPSESWRHFGVQYSDDEISWTLQSNFPLQSWGTNQQKIYDLNYVEHIPGPLEAWRLRNTAWSNNGVAISISDFAMREASDGPDITTGGTPIGALFNPDYPPERAFDADLATFWLANNAGGSVGYDFGTPKNIVAYSIRSRNGYGAEGPKSWVLEASDGDGGWDVFDTQTGVSAWASGETRDFIFGDDPPTVERRRQMPVIN